MLSYRARHLLLFATLALLAGWLLVGLAAVVHTWLPTWAPDSTIRHAPSAEMATRGLIAHGSSPAAWRDRIQQRRPSDVRGFLAMLSSENDRYRWIAADALGEMEADEAVDALIHLLHRDGSSQVRYTAARALGQIGDPRAVPHLLLAMDDPDTVVRNVAVEALGELRAQAAVPAIEAFMARHQYPSAQAYAEEALAKIRAAQDR